MLTINEYGEHVYVAVTLDGDALPGDVLSGKTFFAADPTKQTGTLALTGDASESDVKNGKTFYKDSATTKLTGTHTEPVLSGDAEEADVLNGKTFYKDDPAAKKTGTIVLVGSAAPADVSAGKTFYNTNTTLKTGTSTGTPGDSTNGPGRRAIIVTKEVPSPVEKLSLALNKVLLEEKVDRKKRTLQALQKAQQQTS
jgi:hypothetical protein